MKLKKFFSIFIISMSITLLLTGCSSSKWLKTESANLAPFAQQTISMVGELSYSVSQEEIIYLRGMVDYMGGPEILERYRKLTAQVIRMLKGMVAYSLQLVAISEQSIPIEKQVKVAVKGKNSLSGSEMIKLHNKLTSRMRVFNENSDFVEQDIHNYHKTILELEEIVKNHEDGMKLIRLTFIAWSRAYGRMAAGKTNPAEWFDLSETGSLLMGAARRASGF